MKATQHVVTVSEDGRVALQVPRPAGSRVRVIVLDAPDVLPNGQWLTEEEQFQLGIYTAVIAEDTEEDAIWERYLRG